MVCFTFMVLVSALFLLIRSLIVSRTALATENLALRQQLAVFNRKIHRPQLLRRDRFFWVILSRLWKNWREVLIIVKPETVIRWHRQGFKLYWRWKSKAPVGRSKIDKELRELIKRMSLENPLWGTSRIQSELRLLGFDLAESTVAKYRVRGSASPSQTWKTFLSNHAKQIAAIDFFTVPTLTFRNLYCFIILLHDRRQVIHFNVTAHHHQRMGSSSPRSNFRYGQDRFHQAARMRFVYGQLVEVHIASWPVSRVIVEKLDPNRCHPRKGHR